LRSSRPAPTTTEQPNDVYRHRTAEFVVPHRSSRSGADLNCSRHAEHTVVRQAGVAVGAGHGEGVPPDLVAPDLAELKDSALAGSATCSRSRILGGSEMTVWVVIQVLRHSTVLAARMRTVSGLKEKVLVISTTAAMSAGLGAWAGPRECSRWRGWARRHADGGAQAVSTRAVT
jgi:hypothetical protein